MIDIVMENRGLNKIVFIDIENQSKGEFMKKVSLMVIVFFVSALMMTSAMALDIKEGNWAITVAVADVQGVDDVTGQMVQALKELDKLPEEYRTMLDEQLKANNIQVTEDGIFTTEDTCLTQASPVPHMDEAREDGCDITQDIENNVATFKIVCQDEQEISVSEGEIRYAYDTLKGEVKNYSLENNQRVNDSTVTISGYYVGACQE